LSKSTSPFDNVVQWLYLALAIAGAILPWMANIAFIRTSGNNFDLASFVSLANANPAAQSLSRDLFVGATAITNLDGGRRPQAQDQGAVAGP